MLQRHAGRCDAASQQGELSCLHACEQDNKPLGTHLPSIAAVMYCKRPYVVTRNTTYLHKGGSYYAGHPDASRNDAVMQVRSRRSNTCLSAPTLSTATKQQQELQMGRLQLDLVETQPERASFARPCAGFQRKHHDLRCRCSRFGIAACAIPLSSLLG